MSHRRMHNFRVRTSRIMTVVVAVIALTHVGCQSGKRGDSKSPSYETIAKDPRRDSERARELNAQALEQMQRDKLDEAERTLKKALSADVTFGPAHNNLGKVYFDQNKLYLAAWEFQYAAKLMP